MKDVELFRKGSVHKPYCLKAVITLKQVKTSVAKKMKNLNEQSKLVRCCKLSLYPTKSMTEIMHHVHHVFALWQ